MHLSAHKATKKLGVSSDTLRRWLKQGKISATTSPSGTRLYDLSSLFPELATNNGGSGGGGRKDLEQQKQHLLSRFPTYELISDIGSGVNFKRPGLKHLLDYACRGLVSEVVITHRDRLCRFAFDLFQQIFSVHNVKLVVIFNESISNERELTKDIIAINTIFIEHQRQKGIDDNQDNGSGIYPQSHHISNTIPNLQNIQNLQNIPLSPLETSTE
ncbi:9815_t:CDS:2 [Diversispora eburnea]|uniref:9815_t:CDS:1 n=1 Tax=Diversispora eburnea TaxID=1213867 RepID=A0A9N9A628_9GLOM|nr:9815_t:CDS:2 [Diversispora eburnea]